MTIEDARGNPVERTRSTRQARRQSAKGGLNIVHVQSSPDGVFGVRPIGRAVIDIGCSGFGVKPAAWTFHPENHTDLTDQYGVTFADSPAQLVEMLDLVTLNLPLSAQTRGMIDRSMLERVSPGRARILVNTAREGLSNQAALEQLVEGNKFEAAGLDVSPKGAAHSLEGRVLFSPHLARFADRALRRMRQQVTRRIRRALKS